MLQYYNAQRTFFDEANRGRLMVTKFRQRFDPILRFMREAKFSFPSLPKFWIQGYSTCVEQLPNLHKLKILDPLQHLQSEPENRNHFLERSLNRRHRKCPIQSHQALRKEPPMQTLAESTCLHWRNAARQRWVYDRRRGRPKSSKFTMVSATDSKVAFLLLLLLFAMLFSSPASLHKTVTIT